MEDRVKYLELKEWFLDDAYTWCQRKFRNGKIGKWIGNETEWGEHYILLKTLLTLHWRI